MSPRNEPAEVEVEETPTESSPRGKLAILALALFLAGTGAGYAASMFIPGTGQAEEEASLEEADGEEAEEEAAVADGSILSLGEMLVNLRGNGGGRLLRMEVQVEGSTEAIARCDGRQAQVRDAILTVASDYSWAELEGTHGKMRLHDEILGRINGILRPDRVERVYFTRFVVQ